MTTTIGFPNLFLTLFTIPLIRVESRMQEEGCTIDDLKQCNRWFIDTFSSAGEKVVLIEDVFEKVIDELID